jgi:4-hydroxy-3-methylbut-2-en-1-yl diphosphate synthase IspG/GcpE
MWRRFKTATGVGCPECQAATLDLVTSCLATRVCCPGCGRAFTLDQLAARLDDEAFARLAELVGDRLSDRV